MKRKSRLAIVTSERDAYRAQVDACLRAIDSGNRCIEKADELLAQRDAELALADEHIVNLRGIMERMEALIGVG